MSQESLSRRSWKLLDTIKTDRARINLRWVDDTRHSLLAMAWVGTVEPDGLGIVHGDGVYIWINTRGGGNWATEETGVVREWNARSREI
jgi:hypothetical protein